MFYLQVASRALTGSVHTVGQTSRVTEIHRKRPIFLLFCIERRVTANMPMRQALKTPRPDVLASAHSRVRQQTLQGSQVSNRRHPHRPSHLTVDQPYVFEEQAFWFLSLPNKIKRHHFSREEHVILTDRCERVLHDRSYEPTREPPRRIKTTNRQCCPTHALRKQLFASTSDAFGDNCRAVVATVGRFWRWKAYENKEVTELDPRALRHSITFNNNLLTPLHPPCPALIRSNKRSFRHSFSLRPLPLSAPTLAPLPFLTPPSTRSMGQWSYVAVQKAENHLPRSVSRSLELCQSGLALHDRILHDNRPATLTLTSCSCYMSHCRTL